MLRERHRRVFESMTSERVLLRCKVGEDHRAGGLQKAGPSVTHWIHKRGQLCSRTYREN